jgi:hypothetical protein
MTKRDDPDTDQNSGGVIVLLVFGLITIAVCALVGFAIWLASSVQAAPLFW